MGSTPRPGNSFYDVVNVLQACSKLFGKLKVSGVFFFSLASYLKNLFFTELGEVITSALFYLVVAVCFICPQKQVFWVNARHNVTLMAHQRAGGNVSIGDFPGVAMGRPYFTVPLYLSVPIYVFTKLPEPAITTFVDTIPEPIHSGGVI